MIKLSQKGDKTMFAIIYWVSNDKKRIYPLIIESNKYDGRLKAFRSLQQADKQAYKLEKQQDIEARVISIEGVKE